MNNHSVTASAHGRVNLLGEHTDYQGGFVLPTLIPQHLTVTIQPNGTNSHVIFSESLGKTQRFLVGETGEGFGKFLAGCFALCDVKNGLNVHVAGQVPSGGLSSSAALEVATLRALRDLYNLSLDDLEIALRAVQVEHEWVGVKCGVMDQMVSSLGQLGEALLIDTRNLTWQRRPLPNAAVMVLDSGVPRTLAESGYNTRRAEVEEAARLLGVGLLREISSVTELDSLPPLLHKRARHVVSENARVEAALNADAQEFGHLMNASHTSLQHDYEVSHPTVDALVEKLQAHPTVYGARMTGAGFGGAVVALLQPEGVDELREELQEMVKPEQILAVLSHT